MKKDSYLQNIYLLIKKYTVLVPFPMKEIHLDLAH